MTDLRAAAAELLRLAEAAAGGRVGEAYNAEARIDAEDTLMALNPDLARALAAMIRTLADDAQIDVALKESLRTFEVYNMKWDAHICCERAEQERQAAIAAAAPVVERLRGETK